MLELTHFRTIRSRWFNYRWFLSLEGGEAAKPTATKRTSPKKARRQNQDIGFERDNLRYDIMLGRTVRIGKVVCNPTLPLEVRSTLSILLFSKYREGSAGVLCWFALKLLYMFMYPPGIKRKTGQRIISVQNGLSNFKILFWKKAGKYTITIFVTYCYRINSMCAKSRSKCAKAFVNWSNCTNVV